MSRMLRMYVLVAFTLTTLLAVLALAVCFPRALAQGQNVYVVQAGDNLSAIAERNSTTVEAVMTLNGITDPDLIWVGQRLVLPGGSTDSSTSSSPTAATGGVYIVQRGDTLSGIAVRYGVSLWSLMQANGMPGAGWIYVGQKLVIPGLGGAVPSTNPSKADTYIVRPGDTLSSIAQRFGTTTWALSSLNDIANPALIYPGQVLRVSEPAPDPGPAPTGAKRVLIDISQQHLYAYQGEQLVYSFICSTGAAPYYTRTGQFAVQSKIPNAYGGTWGIWMPHWLGIYWAGGTENGIHALPIMQDGQVLWAGYLGRPVSYGCIVLGTYNATLLYDWADMGTPVTIRD